MNEHVTPPAIVPATANAAYQQARQFLAAVLPWPADDDQPAYVNIHTSYKAEGKDKPLWGGLACTNINDAINVIKRALAKQNTLGIYVCMSTQSQYEARVSQKGHPYKAAIRLQENAVALKDFYIDIDLKGGDRGYDTRDEAIVALAKFIKGTGLPKPTVVVSTGGGYHVHWVVDRPLPPAEWAPLAFALAEATKQLGLKCDAQCTIDSARILRVPDTKNKKYADGPRPVEIVSIKDYCYTVERIEQALAPFKVAVPKAIAGPSFLVDPSLVPPRALTVPIVSELGQGIEERHAPPVDLDEVAKECRFFADALAMGGATHSQPLWNLAVLASTFTAGGRADAHRVGNKHPGYSQASTDEMFDRKENERQTRNLGWPSCAAISGAGCKLCQGCKHLSAGKSPLNFERQANLPAQVTVAAPLSSFVDPYADFVGPAFPSSVLPPVLDDFVEAQYRAMGADPAAIAMAALTVAAGAINAQTEVQVGNGWFEKPIIWTGLVGNPSTKKSPIIAKTTKPLRKIDDDRAAMWSTQKVLWQQAKATAGLKAGPCPPKAARCLLQDATPEKVAEVIARDAAGSLMLQDELAGWLAGFERYNSGATSRAFFLTSWNGGPFLKDRVGQGTRDESAEIRIPNLALGVLGGIQPDKLAAIRDLTTDGLLQRFLPVLMRAAERGNEKHPVSMAEAEYAKLIEAVQAAPPYTFTFAASAEDVRQRVLDRLFELEQGDGFSNAVIGAIGKLKGYFARLALVLHVVGEHSSMIRGRGTGVGPQISRGTAEGAEKLVFDFLLPHMFGLYDVIADGGQDREAIRAIADFILASPKDRLRPSDFGSGVRKLRHQPTPKIAEWASRFIAMGWLRAEDEKLTTPKAWLVEPGLRTQFAARRQVAQAARAAAHAILKAGGSRT
jgi:hypothetical protein